MKIKLKKDIISALMQVIAKTKMPKTISDRKSNFANVFTDCPIASISNVVKTMYNRERNKIKPKINSCNPYIMK